MNIHILSAFVFVMVIVFLCFLIRLRILVNTNNRIAHLEFKVACQYSKKYSDELCSELGCRLEALIINLIMDSKKEHDNFLKKSGKIKNDL